MAKMIDYADFSNQDFTGYSFEDVEFYRVNFSGANLTGTIFKDVDLSSCDLSGANLTNVSFANVSLRLCDFADANLTDVDFSNITFLNCKGNGKEIKELNIPTYRVVITKEFMQIGCEGHTTKDWFQMNEKQIYGMDAPISLLWWREFKETLRNELRAIGAEV